MQSRMERYNSVTANSRTKKNQALYEGLKNSSLENFDVNSNISVISESTNSIDVAKLKTMLDQKYHDESQRRKSIDIPDYPEPVIEEYLVDTKEYDINAILEKAKKGKNVDYNKERLKKIREAQFEILNNLDLELKKVEEGRRSVSIREEEEENLAELVNTITELEKRNKEDVAAGETDDLFASLMETRKLEPVKEPIDDYEENVLSNTVENPIIDRTNSITDEFEKPEKEEFAPFEPVTAQIEIPKDEVTDKTIEVPGTRRTIEPFEIRTSEDEEEQEEDKTEDLKEELEHTEEIAESHLEETLTKLKVNQTNSFDEFSDINKGDTVSIILKVFAFIIVIGLVIGAVYILDNILELGLF